MQLAEELLTSNTSNTTSAEKEKTKIANFSNEKLQSRYCLWWKCKVSETMNQCNINSGMMWSEEGTIIRLLCSRDSLNV